ncbi:perlucin-like, partial [Neocloeon triangulifer]|uniref:perlucin-like n=1 Tax=Neocloeon triangulifer TaxID=2078957 RepID=UPI00286F770F
MKLLSIDFNLEYNNLILAFNNPIQVNGTTKLASPGLYWTSGSDLSCEGNFGWCAVNKLVQQKGTLWAPGEPNNAGKSEHCLAVNLNKTSALLLDLDCTQRMNYICEARNVNLNTTNGEAIVEECRALYNITE